MGLKSGKKHLTDEGSVFYGLKLTALLNTWNGKIREERIMKRLFFLIVCVLGGGLASAQVTLEDCVEDARCNYPQIKELDLIRRTEQYDLARICQSWLPQVNVSGKMQYQSEVVEMPFEIPGYDFHLPHDQYSLVGEVNQAVWDGGSTASKKRMARAEAEVQSRQLEVNLYSIRQRVENLFLGILLLDKQLAQNEIMLHSLYRNRSEVETGIEQGISYKTDLDVVEVSILDYLQKRETLLSDRKTYVVLLGKLTGKDLRSVKFAEPDAHAGVDTLEIRRPELRLYQAQLHQAHVQRQDLQTNLYPKLNLSLQGGVGRPGLNMLKNEFEPYYTVGLKMQWNLGALYSRKQDLRKAEAQADRVQVQQETFVFNTMLDVTDQLNEVHKAEKVLKQDRDIIRLRESIRKTSEEQYRQGVIKMTELMDRMDDEYDARVAGAIHQVQLIMAVCELKNTLGQ